MTEDRGDAGVVWIGKSDVARRQICEAIRLFFRGRDLVAVYTLVSCAHQILVDLGHSQNVDGSIKRKGDGRERFSKLNWPFNFMKHADKDPESRINIGPLFIASEDYIMDAVLLLQAIAGELPIEAKTFWSWYSGTHAAEFTGAGDALKRIMEMGVSDWDFKKIAQFLDFAEVVTVDS